MALTVCCLISCSVNKFYIVRHAEKEALAAGAATADPSLSEAGRERARQLAARIGAKKIGYIFSTNYQRTRETAAPVSVLSGVPITIYSPSPDSLEAFVQRLRRIRKGQVLVVGHSNTIGSLVNRLCRQEILARELPEQRYDYLFEVKRKGKNYILQQFEYGLKD